ncbi:MAG: FliM/FliN family flagellar motor C-terminal domain-containing protein, partial [Paracoccus sp. (in: a-proteobacteria)]
PVADQPPRTVSAIGDGRGGVALPAPVARPDESLIPPVPLPAQTLPEVEVELVGVLCRRHVTLGELRALSAGKLLHLPRVRLSEARVETAQGQVVAQGKFGEAEGCHAIRLRDPTAQGDDDTGLGGLRPRAGAVDADPVDTGMDDYADPGMPLEDLSEPDIFRVEEGLDLPFDSLMPVPLDRAIG